jgi:hypothetical protein
MPLSGLIADSFGWEFVYYFFGTIAMVFAIFWILLAHDSPKEHPRMNQVFFFPMVESLRIILETFFSLEVLK